MVGRRPTLVLDDPLEPDLESALARGEDAWPEFAAWLTEQGSPRGEAIVRERVLNGIGTADDMWLKTIYGAIHRCSAAAQLVARQDSWQFTWLRGFVMVLVIGPINALLMKLVILIPKRFIRS